MYETTTHEFRVRVNPLFLDGQSDPSSGKYFWSYTITVENLGTQTATLKTRHWEITDGLGRKQVVEGDGVVGEQPTLKPGQSFQYTSGCPLTTPSGMMMGRYGMVGEDGQRFAIDVPAFSLDSPHDRRSIN